MKETARAIIKDEDGYIFIKRTNKPGAMYKEYYVFVGGHLEKSETFEEACIREVREELGLEVEIEELFFEIYNEEVDNYEKFYLVNVMDGVLGTGEGEEFSKPDVEKYGTYEIISIKKEELETFNILPSEVKIKLIQSIQENKI